MRYSLDIPFLTVTSPARRSMVVPVAAILAFLFSTLFFWGGPAYGEPRPPNVILFVVDALRPDHVGCYGYDKPTSPYIDSLAAGGIVFEIAVTHAPWTKVSFPSILTSLYPFQHGISAWESVLPDSLLTLPEVLAENGYNTACVVQRAVLDPRFGTLQGFAVTRSIVEFREGAVKVANTAIDALEVSPEPFFLMVHLFDAHKPYSMPDEYVEMVRGGSTVEPYHWNKPEVRGMFDIPTEDEIEGNILLYDAGIRFADYGIGMVLHYLDEKGLGDNTVIMVTADHGEAFWEHGLPLHSTNVYDEAMKVPLIIHYPERFPVVKRIYDQVRLIDLYPTVVDLAGLDIPGHCEGSSLVSLVEGGRRLRPPGAFLPVDVALCECTTYTAPATRTLRTNDYKLICESMTYTFELYNLREDPGEKANLWGEPIAQGDSLFRTIHEVPGVRLRGWRIAFSGNQEGTRFQAGLTLPNGGTFSTVKVMTKSADLGIEIDEGRTRCLIETKEEGPHLVLVDTEPPGRPVGFEFHSLGETGPAAFYAGEHDEYRLGRKVELSTDRALGPPANYEDLRRSGLAALHVWYMPGTGLDESAERARLTPEERERLKSLGYIH